MGKWSAGKASGAEDREGCFSRPELIKLPQSPRRLPVPARTY